MNKVWLSIASLIAISFAISGSSEGVSFGGVDIQSSQANIFICFAISVSSIMYSVSHASGQRIASIYLDYIRHHGLDKLKLSKNYFVADVAVVMMKSSYLIIYPIVFNFHWFGFNRLREFAASFVKIFTDTLFFSVPVIGIISSRADAMTAISSAGFQSVVPFLIIDVLIRIASALGVIFILVMYVRSILWSMRIWK